MFEKLPQKSDADSNEVLGRIYALRAKFSAMGRNDSELPDLKAVEDAVQNAHMSPEEAMQKLDSMEEVKLRGDYN